ncbi:MAG: response regulator [Archangiaceae bacterium]|nr:response regulator [Archangiaceae bacterium]
MPRAPGPLILNVNDSDGARYMVTLMLQRAGFEVVEASTGAGALRMISARMPDLVVLDVHLPDIDGFEVCRRIRDDPETSGLKVLHVSATYITTDKKVESLDGGADGYLAQPFEPEELIATVQALLRLARAERNLRDDAEALREADRRKNEFLSMLAHELRNPLAAITSALPILERRGATDGAEGRARDVVRRQTVHLARLIDDLLDVARVTQGKIELEWEQVNLSELLERVSNNVRSTKAVGRGQRIRLSMPDKPVWVRGDATRLEQVFSNLLDNASKYSNQGGSIRVDVSEVADAKPAVRVVVRDNGIGMAPDTLPHVFALFSQADVPVARTRGGLGIGLTLVRTLVELHGGHVTARSDGIGMGSELDVTLPRVEAPALAGKPQTASDATGATHRRILVIEDNVDVQQAIADLLELSGHEVSCASDGLMGLTRLLDLQPDVALVDIGLPGIDGYEVARRARQSPKGRALTLIALTGYGTPEQQAKSLEAGFDLHLVKPVDPDRLAHVLESQPTPPPRASGRVPPEARPTEGRSAVPSPPVPAAPHTD